MAKIADLDISGESGTSYKFAIYPFDTSWKDDVDCVYAVTKRTKKSGGGGSHAYIYIGQTDDLKARLEDHHKQQCFEEHNANCICVHRESSESKRLEIEDDILKNHSWPCNG